LASFDPFSLGRFSVIRLPYRFEDEHLLSKFFVLLGHHKDGFGEWHAICIKATSQVTVYKNNPDKMCGCVYYRAGLVPCFPVDTVIQPDNQIPIAHKALVDAHFDGALECFDSPPGFEELLRMAVADSMTMSKRLKQRLLDILDTPN